MTNFSKAEVSLLNKKLKKQDQYLKAEKHNQTIFVMYGFANSRDTILQINANESGERTFQVNGFNIFPLAMATVLQGTLKAVAEWNQTDKAGDKR